MLKKRKITGLILQVLLLAFTLVYLSPIIYMVLNSLKPYSQMLREPWALPESLFLDNYIKAFGQMQFWTSLGNSIVITASSVFLIVILGVLAAYPLSRKDLAIRNPVMLLFTFTMLFNGGMIPTYILIKNLGMLDTIWALVIPTSISVWNLIITRTYFQSTIPGEVQESASVDGCDDFTFLIKIAIPLAKPILAVNVLLYAVGHWNSYFNEMMYLSTNTKFPLQLVLREILVNMGTAGMTLDVTKQLEMQETKYLLQYSSIIVGSVPVMLLYPFVQKYFVKGIMVGAIKG